jgi:hypothetical protein
MLVSGVNYFFRSATIRIPYRVDSSLLLPSAARCLMKNATRPNERAGGRLRRQLSLTTRRELIEAVAARYRAAERNQKKEILDEFVKVTGFHRKHAIRALKKSPKPETPAPRQRARIYDEAVREALTIVWEAADRICGKRLRQVIAGLVGAMERHGHLQLDGEVRESLLCMSAATMDRLLTTVRGTAKQGRRKTTNNTLLRKSIPVRTFGDWRDPAPGFFEMDMVVHCGKATVGSYVHSLVLTDIASGWTEAIAMVVREQTLITESVREVRTKLPVTLRGLDVDNDSAFINDTLVDYCRDNKIELTRCRAYKKNDQAWIEQKNGAVIRRMVGYGRLEGAAAAVALNKLYTSARLFVNFFQPSFKLLSKTREGAKVIKKYHPPATPCERLLERKDVSDEGKRQLHETLTALDPVRLLSEIREAQRVIAQLEIGAIDSETAQTTAALSGFVASLSTAWRDGEVRPTHRKRSSGPRTYRTRVDPFEAVWPQVQQWLNEQPDANAKDLFHRLRESMPGAFAPGQLRTLQRRVKQWRSEVARQLVFGLESAAEMERHMSVVAANADGVQA